MNKIEIRKEMYQFLESKGFPKMSVQQLFDALPDMYRHLESKKLLPNKINFAIFKQVALRTYKETEMLNKIQQTMRGFGVNF